MHDHDYFLDDQLDKHDDGGHYCGDDVVEKEDDDVDC